MTDARPMTIERIDAALDTVARAVVDHGPAFRPIFERLEAERARFVREADGEAALMSRIAARAARSTDRSRARSAPVPPPGIP